MGLRIENGEAAGSKTSAPGDLSHALVCDAYSPEGISGGGRLELNLSGQAGAGTGVQLPELDLSGDKHALPIPKPLEETKAKDEGLDHKPMYKLPHYLLSDEQKHRIDTYLRLNKLNQYGDPLGATYPAGDPMIDERTGQRMNRYDFVLARVKKPGLDRDKLVKAE